MANGNGSKLINVQNLIGAIVLGLLLWAGTSISSNQQKLVEKEQVDKAQDKEICEAKEERKEAKDERKELRKDVQSMVIAITKLTGELNNTNNLLNEKFKRDKK